MTSDPEVPHRELALFIAGCKPKNIRSGPTYITFSGRWGSEQIGLTLSYSADANAPKEMPE